MSQNDLDQSVPTHDDDPEQAWPESQDGCLDLDEEHFWEFVTWAADGKVIDWFPLPDLNCTWKDRVQQGTLTAGWGEELAWRTIA